MTEWEIENEAIQEARRQQIDAYNLARTLAGETPTPTQSPTDLLQLIDQETGAQYATPLASLPTSGAARFEVSVPLIVPFGFTSGMEQQTDVWVVEANPLYSPATIFDKSSYEGCTSIRFRAVVGVTYPENASATLSLRLALGYASNDPDIEVVDGSEMSDTSTAEWIALAAIPTHIVVSPDIKDALPADQCFVLVSKKVSNIVGATMDDFGANISNLALVISYGET